MPIGTSKVYVPGLAKISRPFLLSVVTDTLSFMRFVITGANATMIIDITSTAVKSSARVKARFCAGVFKCFISLFAPDLFRLFA